jgi:glycosyltransferase involved in cell wall biosynthesis
MLVMVGREDIFYTRLRSKIGKSPFSQSLLFWGEASDYELTSLYKHARALIFPSLSEGFGLPAFEAFSFGCPVICSDIPVFRELLGLFPVYIDPINPQSIADAIDKVICNGSTVSMHDWKRQTQKFKWNFVNGGDELFRVQS